MRERLVGRAPKDLRIHVVWTKVLAGDTRELAEQRAREIGGEGVCQYWDGQQTIGGLLACGMLPVGDAPLAWDVYLFFAPGETWEVEGAPPGVSVWTHQLSGADPERFANGRIGERLEAGFKAMCGTPAERVDGALALLRAAESFDGAAVGEGGDKLESYRAYERLRDSATRERLLALVTDSKPVVRCYALQALAERHPDVDLLPILRAHLRDVEEVLTFEGCLGSKEKTGDVMMRIAREWERLAPEQRLSLAEAVLDSPLDERRRMLHEETFPPEWRPRLRALAEGGDGDALVALARMRIADDWILIDRALHQRPLPGRVPLHALIAAAHHADPRLLPALEALPLIPERRVRFLYRALAAQESAAAAQLLLRVAGTTADSRGQLAEALDEHRVPAFDPVLWWLWREEVRLSPGALQRLAALDGEQARQLAERDLSSGIEDIPGNLLPLLLDLQPRDRQVQLVWGALEGGVVNAPLAERAADLRHASFVEPLFGLLVHKNPYRYLPAARALLAYRSAEIDARVRATVASHDHLRTGWGGKEMARLLGE